MGEVDGQIVKILVKWIIDQWKAWVTLAEEGISGDFVTLASLGNIREQGVSQMDDVLEGTLWL